MSPEQHKALELLQSRTFRTKVVVRNANVSAYTVWKIQNGYIPMRTDSIDRIVHWMHSLKDQMP